ncbi:MAG: hypothetical protein ACR9NN_25360 [Nostochopsis sp.]
MQRQNMKSVETEIHQQFKKCRVKLEKSREYFDLNPWQFLMVNMAFNRHASGASISKVPISIILGVLLGLTGVGVIVGQVTQPPQPPQLDLKGKLN